ncbi:hypothetical protein A7E78_04540 [Syntrophotalea acetylenivorans]|uniref:DUF4124 domain-containing protein n=1 Tax=Syntrophotalea acetylenivorans TaxID=1842532 RepID=A0A1L3GMJ2_9BACT|nr:hypothetical protein [Syntrophotalea acetylenivorans]APG27166.1 hypothetical protein A7E78_04540 [Syntrophotalea acetylenivorans]
MTKKHLTFFFISLFISPFGDMPEANAQVYSCVTVEGVPFFTDNPALIPPGCHATSVNEREGLGGLSIVVSPPTSTEATEVLLVEMVERKKKQNEMAKELKKTAENLVAQYNQALTRLHRTRRVSRRLKIRGEIREIKERRDTLLLKAAAGSLPFRNRGTINEILAAIPP